MAQLNRQEMIDQIARQVAEHGNLPSEQRIKEIVNESITPYEERLRELEGRKFVHQSNGGRSIEGTRYARFYDATECRYWNADDVEFLHDLMEAAEDAKLSKRGRSEILRNWHAENNTRAMDTAESGYGAELIGVQYVGELWAAARERSVLFTQIPAFEMNAPSAYLPVEAAPPEMFLVSENTAADASDYGTTKTGSNRVLVTAYKFIIHQMFSGEMEEDSIIPYVPFLRRQAAWSLGYYSDSAVLNGDQTNAGTGNINSDNADPTDTKHYLAFDGLRHAAISDNTDNASDHSAAVISYDACRRLPKLMLDRTYLMDWGHPLNPNDLIYVANPELADEIGLLDETLTVDKYGPAATVLTGEVTKIGRHPLVSTVAMPLTETDGKANASGSAAYQLLAFNRLGSTVGWRRRVKFETERLPGRDQTRIVWSLRMGFNSYSPTGARSAIESVAVLYNIAAPS